MPARPERELAAVRLVLADDLGDLVEAVPEDVVEQEDRPLDRAQPLEQEQERHRQRVGLLRLRGRVGGALVGQQRLGQPLADVRLASDPRRRSWSIASRVTTVDRYAFGDSISTPSASAPLVAQERLLHDVLGLAHAAEHPVGDREQQRRAA